MITNPEPQERQRLYNGEKIKTGPEWGDDWRRRTELERQEEGVSMCKWEGEGISRGRVQHGNEREGWHSLGLIQGPLWQCGEPHTMHGCVIATETPPSTTAMEGKEWLWGWGWGEKRRTWKSHLRPPESVRQTDLRNSEQAWTFF